MLVLGRAARDLADGARRIEAAIASGAGWERFARCIELQGGDRRVLDRPEVRLPQARRHLDILAPRAGVVSAVDARAVGQAATLLGAGRLRKEDRVDPAVGITLHHQVGGHVERRQSLATLHVNDRGREAIARALVAGAFQIGATRPRRKPLILETIAR
jgi:thymidine phosphorylase